MYFDTTLQVFDIKVKPEPHPDDPTKNHLVLLFVTGIVVPTGEIEDPETGEKSMTQDVLPVGVYKVPCSPEMGMNTAKLLVEAVESMKPEDKANLLIAKNLDGVEEAVAMDRAIRGEGTPEPETKRELVAV